MKLYVGGYAQGKLKFVLQRIMQENGKQQESCMVWDGAIPDGELVKEAATQVDTMPQSKTIIFNHFHQWIKNCIQQGGCPEKEIMGLLERYPDCIIISDEIGNGIVPMDAFEREYRERTGRILVELAKQAEEVERVICGIGQRIK